MRGTGTLTETGTVLGTASYLSPEQATGDTAGPASDVYSFGVILFRLLSGRLPFEAKECDGARCDAPRRRASARQRVRADAPATSQRSPARHSRRTWRPGRPTARHCRCAARRPARAGHAIVAPPPRRRRLPIAAAGVAAALLVAGIALALALTRHDGNGGVAQSQSVPTLTLPTARPPSTTIAASATTTAPVTTAETTSRAAPTGRWLRERPLRR